VTGTQAPGGCVVEVCGLPGAGKSRVAAALVASAGAARTVEAGAPADRPRPVGAPADRIGPHVPTFTRLARKLALGTREAAARPGSLAGEIRAIVHSGQEGELVGTLARVSHWVTTQRLLADARHAGGLQVLDEGVLQALWSLGLRGDVTGLVRRLERSEGWRRPDVLVMVEAPLSVALTRLGERSSAHSRVQQLGADARLAELRRGQELFEDLLSWWGARTPVVRVPNDVAGEPPAFPLGLLATCL
jgi:AAA domain